MRHVSGKKLFDVCDLVIDNCGDFEGSSMQFDGLSQKMATAAAAMLLTHKYCRIYREAFIAVIVIKLILQ